MGTAIDYKKELINLTKELPESKLNELLDFAQFLKAKSKGFTYMDVEDSAEYVRELRAEEGKQVKSSEKFIEELMEWQKSNS
jgi:hypothetical protein